MNQALIVQSPKELMTYLSNSKSSIEMALPKHLNADRMIRLALTCFSGNEDLRQCSAISILRSLIVASQVGLEPGINGQGYLIPYKGVCTFVPGWQGLVGLLNNSGRATAWTGAVFEGDTWEYELGSAPKCRHLPGENFGNPEKLTWVYACGKVNGAEQTVVESWPMRRVIFHRNQYNKVGAKHYSYQNMEMYARKVVLLQVLKYMPRSIELSNAITASDIHEMGRASIVDGGIIIEQEEDDIPQEPAPAKPAPKAARATVSAPLPPTPAPAAPAAPATTTTQQRPAPAEGNPEFAEPPPALVAQQEREQAAAGVAAETAAGTVQAELQDLCESSGFNLTVFTKWAIEAKWVPAATTFASWSAISIHLCTRCLRAKDGLLKGMARIKEGGRL